MTYNEKKQFLENYGYSVRKIKRLLQEYEEWETIGTSITQKFNNTPVQVSGNHSRVETCAMHLANLQQTILEEMEEAEYCRSEIETAIGTIRDTRRRELLELRYLKGLSVHKIASKRNCPDKNIYKQLRNTINRMEL
jgi:RNA polymerase sigma factor (sigma-70 family)